MKDLNYDLRKLGLRNRDGADSTQANRARILSLIANQLIALGYRELRIRSLKPKHVHALVDQWLYEGKKPGTIKNRMAALRWWLEKIGKEGVMRKDNDFYGVPHRELTARESKAIYPEPETVASIRDLRIQISVMLQQAFGLRREEAMKIKPAWADRGDIIVLRSSWCKGGRAREIPITADSQREILDMARAVAGSGSMIPSEDTYVKHMRKFEKETAAVDLGNTHSLRHAYAQGRYEELSDLRAPVNGGKSPRDLTDDEKKRDTEARLQVSAELGHARKEVTGAYLGGILAAEAAKKREEAKDE
ncbi:Integrase [Mariprofundus ferrinatatus]|uniref:Integrase n=1 Tax=Mariprofundus ferrinatatus TaxID=1921087 RepID=A0A2K8L303_9PROT|nr:phage integrase N-terminal domain-containing protein [Mariprofundus ferrinatatus]ATX81715.1 Integrase [Mariprofundus ferrinatatus]